MSDRIHTATHTGMQRYTHSNTLIETHTLKDTHRETQGHAHGNTWAHMGTHAQGHIDS